jgi:hypothetical protein
MPDTRMPNPFLSLRVSKGSGFLSEVVQITCHTMKLQVRNEVRCDRADECSVQH